MFDDVLEAQKIGKFNFGEMLYASSWVATEIEDYPQWSMYGDAMRGVRISLPRNPFDWHEYVPGPDGYADNVIVPMPMSEAEGKDFKIFPFLSENDFLRDVTYVRDVAEVWRKNTWLKGDGLVSQDPRALASHKDERWSFQKECRFILHVLRRPENEASTTNGSFGTIPAHIDVPLSHTALQNLEVTLGPLRRDSDRIISEALLKSHAPSASLHESSLLGAVRARKA